MKKSSVVICYSMGILVVLTCIITALVRFGRGPRIQTRVVRGSYPSARLLHDQSLNGTWPLIVDGETVHTGDTILINTTSETQENGLYYVSDKKWIRHTTMARVSDFIADATVYVHEGNVYGKVLYVLQHVPCDTIKQYEYPPVNFIPFTRHTIIKLKSRDMLIPYALNRHQHLEAREYVPKEQLWKVEKVTGELILTPTETTESPMIGSWIIHWHHHKDWWVMIQDFMYTNSGVQCTGNARYQGTTRYNRKVHVEKSKHLHFRIPKNGKYESYISL